MIVVAKLGSSTLVDADGGLRTDVLGARVDDLIALRRRGHRVVLVSSGAIACGIGALNVNGRPTALPDLQAASAVGQAVLFQHYVEAVGPHGVRAAQVLLTSGDLAARRGYINARNTLERLLELGALPIINENDTVATDELTFGDNDVLAAHVAVLLGAGLLVLLTEREGLYGRGADGPQVIRSVGPDEDLESLPLADMGRSAAGRGGIASKLASLAMASSAGVPCVVASGTAPGVLAGVVDGEAIGTRVEPRRRRTAAFKIWLRHAKQAMGTIAIDAGATRALSERGTSLLAVGVSGCEGAFLAGDAVDVVDGRGVLVGRGIVDLSADELRGVIGLSSDEVRRRLPGAGGEVIHRDRFVLIERPDGAHC